MIRSKASLDNLSIIITIGVALLFVALGGLFSFLSGDEFSEDSIKQVPLVINLLVWSVFIFCYLFHPNSYSVNDLCLIIHRPIHSRQILLSDIRQIREVSKDEMSWAVRTFGNGGIFGYYGKFYNKTFGSMTWYASRRERFILLDLSNQEKIAITPDKPDFIFEIKERLPPHHKLTL